MSIKLGIPVGVHLSHASLVMMTLQPVGMDELKEVDPMVHRWV